MAEVKWIKLYTDMFEISRKLKQIEAEPKGDTILIIWIKLLLLAGRINDGGAIYITPEKPYTDVALASELRRPTKAVKTALSLFEEYDMIYTEGGIIYVSSWEKYQNIDGMEKIRERDRERKRAKRAEKGKNVRGMSADKSTDVREVSEQSPCTELDTRYKNKDIDTFTTTTTDARACACEAPNLAEVFIYFRENCDEDAISEASKFHAYNANRGWDCLPDWEATADLWIARIGECNKGKGGA